MPVLLQLHSWLVMIGPAGPGILQHGSLGEGKVFASVQMEYKIKADAGSSTCGYRM